MANAYEIIDNAEYALDRGDINLAEYEAIIRPWRDAEPVKHGRWIKHNLYIECPLCHRKWNSNYNDIYAFNYCPNCGADMREAEREPTMEEYMYGQDLGSVEDGSL